jgi:hypothetical protein
VFRLYKIDLVLDNAINMGMVVVLLSARLIMMEEA